VSDRDIWRRLQAVEKQVEKQIKRQDEFENNVKALLTEIVGKQNNLVDRLEDEGVLGDGKKVITLH